MSISIKYKRYDKNINKKYMEKLIEYDDWFKKLFSIKYLELFSLYYNNAQPLNQLSLFNKIIIFSEETKSFYDLLQKNNNSKEEIIQFVKLFYLPEKNIIMKK